MILHGPGGQTFDYTDATGPRVDEEQDVQAT
jgi:hypothetical protein